ncbi:MAG TPA: NAD-dependent epimerase/dehydratase family protein [Kiritimatiellia bacterium]|nr:NAD-dependent epimerase/dehydratase family protein [Kiritimatiellia bacterium]
MRNILITGGAGFIGFHLAEELSRDGTDHVVLLDSLVRGRRDADLEGVLRRANVKLVEGDVTDRSVWDKVGGPFDEVYHLAAVIGVRHVLERPHDVVRVNALGTLDLLDWFGRQKGGKLVFASTSEVYAWTQQFHPLPVPTPEAIPLSLTDLSNPRSSYAGSKMFGELAVTHIAGKAGKPFSIVRYHNVYGLRMGFEHVIPEVFRRVTEKQHPLVVYAAEHRRAFCHVSDAVAGTVLAMRHRAADGGTFNLGNDEQEIRMADLARAILQWAKVEVPLQEQPAPHDPIARRCPDITRARQVLGYAPRINLEEGLRRTLPWYAAHYGWTS